MEDSRLKSRLAIEYARWTGKPIPMPLLEALVEVAREYGDEAEPIDTHPEGHPLAICRCGHRLIDHSEGFGCEVSRGGRRVDNCIRFQTEFPA